MKDQNRTTEKLDAELSEVDAELDVLKAEAEGHEAKAEMAELSALRGIRDDVRDKLADLKEAATENLETSRRAVQHAVHDLEVAIERVKERYAGWDEARERRFNARLDEAGEKLKAWKARVAATADARWDDALDTLDEYLALARTRIAEWRRARNDRAAEEALEVAASDFNKAYDAAEKRYGE